MFDDRPAVWMTGGSACTPPVSFGKAENCVGGDLPTVDAVSITMNEGAAVKIKTLVFK